MLTPQITAKKQHFVTGSITNREKYNKYQKLIYNIIILPVNIAESFFP